MCKIYFVMVRRSDDSYVDSTWLVETSAAKRVATLNEAFCRAGLSSSMWRAWVSEALLEDGKVETEQVL